MRSSPLDDLLAAAERVCSLKLCLHTQLPCDLSPRWRIHNSSVCLANKKLDVKRCRDFDGNRVHQAMKRRNEGRIHECPFGLLEIAIPLKNKGRMLGILFAGQAWCGKGRPPHPDLVVIPSRTWLEDRLTLLTPLTRELALHLDDEAGASRSRKLGTLMINSTKKNISVEFIAKKLSLSPSRTSHLIKETYGESLTQLTRRNKLENAARLLSISDDPVAKVAADSGFEDQNYFSRLFRRQYGVSPSTYRKQKPVDEI